MAAGIMARTTSEIIEVNSQQLEELLERAASNTLREEDTELIGHVFESYMHLFEIVGDKNTTIARLRKLFFGASSEKSDKLLGEQQGSETSVAPDGDNADSLQACSESEADDDTGEQPSPGHGRHSAGDYLGATQVDVPHPTLCAGDDCPCCQKGTVYEKSPRVFVRFVGQAPLHATVYRLQRLRCNLCGEVFTAPAPEAMGAQKYDHTVASMIGLLKYGSGMPFNRLQGLQRNCAVPLAASTQWGIVHAGASLLTAAHEELIRQAAQGEVLYNDDTTVKILELMGERAKKSPPPDDPHDPDRTGLFTSGVVSTCAGQQIAIFFSGRQHAGENLSDVLKHRATDLDAPIQMCDGLSRNVPQELATILANCMAHSRRKFADLYDRFTDQCRYVIKALKVIYHNDKVTREKGMSQDERVSFHQNHSKPCLLYTSDAADELT